MSNRLKVLVLSGLILGDAGAFARSASPNDQPKGSSQQTIPYVQDFTAYTLNSGQIKLGVSGDYGITRRLMIGSDLLVSIAGAPNIKVKSAIWENGRHTISLGLSFSYLSRRTALWGSLKKHFEELDAQVSRPQVSWSQRISSRLILHTHWSIGIGQVNAQLSEEGRRFFWQSKYPKGNYDTQDKLADTDDNVEANLSLAHRTLQAQSLMGLSRDFFQITGEFTRDQNKRILLSSRISNLQLEDLKSQDLRITATQEWRHGAFNFRLGLGVLYQVLSGSDLDGENVDDAGFLPAGDFDFYWLF